MRAFAIASAADDASTWSGWMSDSEKQALSERLLTTERARHETRPLVDAARELGILLHVEHRRAAVLADAASDHALRYGKPHARDRAGADTSPTHQLPALLVDQPERPNHAAQMVDDRLQRALQGRLDVQGVGKILGHARDQREAALEVPGFE
jgi:hypothetical protein